jgi:hypothetical protein
MAAHTSCMSAGSGRVSWLSRTIEDGPLFVGELNDSVNTTKVMRLSKDKLCETVFYATGSAIVS